MDAVLPALVGRDEELEALEALLRTEALPASLLVEGEAGVGKTSLCVAATELARERGFETLAARPAESEAELALASAGDLLRPVLDRVLDELPVPQARALRVALLLDESEATPDALALVVRRAPSLRGPAADDRARRGRAGAACRPRRRRRQTGRRRGRARSPETAGRAASRHGSSTTAPPV